MRYLSILIFWISSCALWAQEFQLNWTVVESEYPSEYSGMYFEGASISGNQIPLFHHRLELPVPGKAHVELFDPQFVPLTAEELSVVPNHTFQSTVQIEQTWTASSGKEYVAFQLTPIIRDAQTLELKKLVSFDVIIVRDESVNFKTSDFASESVLAQGDWVRAAISNTGIHSLSISELQSAGLSGLIGSPSSQLKAYHNGGGMLPEEVADQRYDDLREINIEVRDGGDGVLNGSDRVYFFAGGPHALFHHALSGELRHAYNVYDERSYVYFTVDATSPGLRVSTNPYAATPTVTSTGLDMIAFHEEDERNLAGTGREWYGEVFDFQLSRNYSFSFPSRDITEPVQVRFRGANSGGQAQFQVQEGGVVRLNQLMAASTGVAEYLAQARTASFTSPQSSLSLDVVYSRIASPSSVGYLDYLSAQARLNWSYSSGEMYGCDTRVVQPGEVVGYSLNNSSNVHVWDLTDRTRPYRPAMTNGTWSAPADSLRWYVVWKDADVHSVAGLESVSNQNLHSLEGIDYLIVTHAEFLAEAERLAEFHAVHDNLTYAVVDVEQVYHEFSCGSQDISAIRDFARMLYKDANRPLKHLLLFGDASYDYKDRVSNMHNFVPIYQSPTSNSLYQSFMTDDFYANLDDMEGVNIALEDVDINTGRFPVKTLSEARNVVDKVIGYAVDSSSFGDWRNRLLFVSDDADEGWETILTTAPEAIAAKLDTTYPSFNIQKIYADSYTQQSSSGSQSYPAAREALFRSVERGNLVTAYVGHGGEVGWASERLLQLQDINAWTNSPNLPLFVTITCEFTRFDDPFRVSAGEQVFLNPDGGAVALISTTRVVYVQPAVQLNQNIFDNIFKRVNGEYPTMGDIVRQAKNSTTSGDALRFSLIGDPALKLNIPVHEVVIDSLNGVDIQLAPDTLKARETVRLSGRVLQDGGGDFSSFNGQVTIAVYDKAINRQTNKNDGVGGTVNFKQQENLIYRGRASVVNGYWNTEFIVPRDINYVFGEGKISLYADNDVTDARGAERRLIVGGLGSSVVNDDRGPEIRLFMNDTNFIDGGITDENPVGLALLFDESGINVVGNGLGHDIVGVLDGDESNSFVLNGYYEGDVDTYKSGRVEYPFYDLSNGAHNLRVRVWDVMNNVAEADVDFVVADRQNIQIGEIFSYPNPFTDWIIISFEHNRAGEELALTLHISNMAGQTVYHYDETIVPEGNRSIDLRWDARTNGGREVSAGLYVFRLVVRSTSDGQETSVSERLVYLK